MNNSLKFTFGLAIALILSARIISAQTNPTGVSGEFNGDITTGCNYDPMTGNARRTITDLTVAGAVGAYPLAFGRTALSRFDTTADPPIATYFGLAGSWRHSYQWSIDKLVGCGRNCKPGYIVNYPDGRRIKFDSATESGDVYYRRDGVRDRFEPVLGGIVYYLHLADGGKVAFDVIGNTFKLKSITDPYGQVTNITYPADGNTLITEPAGRWIKIFFRTITQASEGAVGDTIIDHVAASDGRSVQYIYSAYIPPADGTTYTTLTGATYFGDPTLTATYTYKDSNIFGLGRPLLATCNDPMYDGPMKKISYAYEDAVYGQPTPPAGFIVSEKSGTTGQVVSSLSFGINGYFPIETRGDGKTRSFSYGPPGFLLNWTDWKGVSMSQTYDTRSFVNSVTDANGKTTNWTNDILSGRTTSITYPLTPNDTPSGTPRGTETFTYGSATCPDPNNRDATNPYYLYSRTDEGTHTTVSLRDTNKRVTQINYPDGGSESFTYNSFGQVLTHGMKTGGTESFSYDARGLKQTYRDAYHQSGNPTAWYQYDSFDRVSGVTDALGSASGDINHTTNYTYSSRGQLLVTTHPIDPTDGQRHTIANAYYPDGTLASVTDELGHVSSSTYDDYRRVRSVTSPGHNTPVTAYTYYDTNGTGDDYTHTDANVTHATAPGGGKIANAYDENYRKISTIVGDGTSDAAKTSYGYDNNGNITSVISPNEQPGQLYAGKSTITAFDERNRVMSVTDPVPNAPTIFKYDAGGRKLSMTRPNGQVITYDSYDAMNRLLQQTVKQTPDPDAVTKFTYYTSGLLHTMQDPRLVANNSIYNYNYVYDQMGRKTTSTYPPDSFGVQRSEVWHYDTAGRIDTFTNRNNKVQTITNDALNRKTGFSWNDSFTPAVSFGCDPANRVKSIVNANATITRTFYNDNLVNTETTAYADNTQRVVTYTFNADGKRGTLQYPNGAYSFTYSYTGRNQLKTLVNNAGGATIATYRYEPNGNLVNRTPDNGASSTFGYDVLDRVTSISHAFITSDTRTFGYAYDSVSNRKWTKRDGGNGDVFGYDANDQVISILLNIANPDTTPPGNQTINYDANGSRTIFSAYGPTDTYATNNLNQYSSRNSNTAIYDINGNMTTGVDGSTYVLDAQNRLITATKAGTTETFKYDGLDRQIGRTIGSNPIVYNVYDGWNLIGEYAAGATTPSAAYLAGAGGLVKNLITNRYYYQDASGSSSHLTDSTGHLLEWYRYDLQGVPVFYDAANKITSSGYSIRHLLTGQQWYSELGLYDLRNRFYSPDIGRFIQADPIGFAGDPSNLYRYCGNNPLTKSDSSGLYQWTAGGAFFGGLVVTWGTNSGQSNFGIYSGVGMGAIISYSPVNAPSTSPGFVQGMIERAGYSTPNSTVSASYTATTRGAQLELNGGQQAGQASGKAGIAIDHDGNVTSSGPTFGFGRLGFIGFGGTWFGDEAFSFQTVSDGNIAYWSNGAFDAAAVDKAFTAATNTFDNPSLAQNSAQAPFDVSLSLTNFGGGTTGGSGLFGAGGGSFGGGGNPTGLWGDPSGARSSAGGPSGGFTFSVNVGALSAGGGGKPDPPPKIRQ
jgi:RHS repeat-associated protein